MNSNNCVEICDDSINWLRKTIDNQRQHLNELVNKYKYMCHPLIVNASQELDNYVLQLQKLILEKNNQ